MFQVSDTERYHGRMASLTPTPRQRLDVTQYTKLDLKQAGHLRHYHNICIVAITAAAMPSTLLPDVATYVVLQLRSSMTSKGIAKTLLAKAVSNSLENTGVMHRPLPVSQWMSTGHNYWA